MVDFYLSTKFGINLLDGFWESALTQSSRAKKAQFQPLGVETVYWYVQFRERQLCFLLSCMPKLACRSCVGKSAPPARQTNTTRNPWLAFVLENLHHQHVKPTPPATLRLEFVLENPHHPHVKPPPPATCRLAFVLDNQHHKHVKPPPPANLRLAFVLENPNHQHVKPRPPATLRLGGLLESCCRPTYAVLYAGQLRVNCQVRADVLMHIVGLHRWV